MVYTYIIKEINNNIKCTNRALRIRSEGLNYNKPQIFVLSRKRFQADKQHKKGIVLPPGGAKYQRSNYYRNFNELQIGIILLSRLGKELQTTRATIRINCILASFKQPQQFDIVPLVSLSNDVNHAIIATRRAYEMSTGTAGRYRSYDVKMNKRSNRQRELVHGMARHDITKLLYNVKCNDCPRQ